MKIRNMIGFLLLLATFNSHAVFVSTQNMEIYISPNIHVSSALPSDFVSVEHRQDYSVTVEGYSGPGSLIAVEYAWTAFSDIGYSHSVDPELEPWPSQSNQYFVSQDFSVTTPFADYETPWPMNFPEYFHLREEPSGVLHQPVWLGNGLMDNPLDFSEDWLLEGDITTLGTIWTHPNSALAEIHFSDIRLDLEITYFAEELVPVPLPASLWLFGGSLLLLNRLRRPTH